MAKQKSLKIAKKKLAQGGLPSANDTLHNP